MVDRVVIVSTGRTATKSIAHFLSRAEQGVEAHHTTSWSRLFNVLSNMELANLIPGTGVKWAWRALKGGRWGPDRGNECFVDSSNHLYAVSRQLLNWYPSMRLVHIVRDPRTYVPSHLRWIRNRRQSYIANRIVPFWQPNGWLVGEYSLRDWHRMSEFARFCWIWDFKNRYIEATGGMYPQRYLRLRFEDLVAGGAQAGSIERLRQFVGLAADEGAGNVLPAANRSGGAADSGAEELSEAELKQVERICGGLMERYGYRTD